PRGAARVTGSPQGGQEGRRLWVFLQKQALFLEQLGPEKWSDSRLTPRLSLHHGHHGHHGYHAVTTRWQQPV
ncbi:unnamed protein product, partial [Tetraodon nigroviridis]